MPSTGPCTGAARWYGVAGSASSLKETRATVVVPAAHDGLACPLMSWRKGLLSWLFGTMSEPVGKLLALSSPGCKQRGSSPRTPPQHPFARRGHSRALGPSLKGCALAVVPPPAGPGQGCGCPEGGCRPPRAPSGPGGAAQGRVAPGLSSRGSYWHGHRSQPRPRRQSAGWARGLPGAPARGWLWRGVQAVPLARGTPAGQGRAGMGREAPGLGRAGSRAGDDVWADVSDRTR